MLATQTRYGARRGESPFLGTRGRHRGLGLALPRKLREFPTAPRASRALGRRKAAGGDGKETRRADLGRRGGELLRTLPADVQTWSLNFSPDLRHLTAAARGKVLVWDLASSNAPVELPHARRVVGEILRRTVVTWSRRHQIVGPALGREELPTPAGVARSCGRGWCTAFTPDRPSRAAARTPPCSSGRWRPRG